MKICEAVRAQLLAMEQAGTPINGESYNVPLHEMREFGDLEFNAVESKKGRGGRVYSVFHTERGLVGFWPLASNGPRLGPCLDLGGEK